jgi:uncharacterized protein (TIGR02118 family)
MAASAPDQQEITMANDAFVTIYVTYEGTSTTRFDREYYVAHHLPRVMRAWQKYGLEGVSAFFPAIEASGTIAICECRFRDETAVTAAFGSPETPDVMADVPCFTDVEPVRARAASL